MSLAAQWLQPLFAAWIDMALAACAGIAVVRGAMPPSATSCLPVLARRIAILLGVGLAGYLSAATVAMAQPGLADFPGALWVVLAHTDFGDMGLTSAAAWLALMIATSLACTRRAARDRFPHRLFLLGIVVFAYARAATGHAADHGFLSVAVLVHTLHILSACVWAGSIGVGVLSIAAWRDWPGPQRSVLAHRLSAIATMAVPGALVTGLFNVARTLGHSSHVAGSPYLGILVAKVALVALAVVLGTWNRWSWMKHLDSGRSDGPRGFGTVLAVESVVLLAVLALAAKLGTTMIPV